MRRLWARVKNFLTWANIKALCLRFFRFLRKLILNPRFLLCFGIAWIITNGWCYIGAALGVSTVICTDISKDGAMNGTNRELYQRLSERYSVQIVASGGVSDLEDVRALREMNLYGAIIGKAYYTGAIDLREALEVAK